MGSKISALVFQPPEVSYSHDKKSLIWLRTVKEKSIPAFYIDRKSKVTVLFSHGNAEDIGMIYEWFCDFARELNVNVLAYDYEGYGKATGIPNEQSCYEDIDAAYNFLTEVLHFSAENIVLYGRSLGSGPSCYLAERLHKRQIRLGGMILQSPLLSIFRVAFNFRFTMPCDMFPNIDRIKNTSCPIFILHGVKDEVIPFWNGEMLFLAAPVELRAKPFWVVDGSHNNIEEMLREDRIFYLQFAEFLSEWVPVYNSCRNSSSMMASTATSSSSGTIHSSALRDMDYNTRSARDSSTQQLQQQRQQQHYVRKVHR